MRARIKSMEKGDVLNAILAIVLTAVTYWQGEVAMRNLRENVGRVSNDVADLKRDVNTVRKDGQNVNRSTRRIEGATRELLKEKRKDREDAGLFRLPW